MLVCRIAGGIGTFQVDRSCAATEICAQEAGVFTCVDNDEPPPSCADVVETCSTDGAARLLCNATTGALEPTVCGVDSVCVLDGGDPICIAGNIDCSAGPDACICLPDPTPSCLTRLPPGGGQRIAFERIYETCGAEPTDADCAEGLFCFDGEGCTSSVLNEDSPFYEFSCPLVQHFEFRTSFDADCRCFENQLPSGPDVCDRPTRVSATGFRQGAGPSMVDIFGATYNGGFVEGDELIVAVQHGGSSARKGLIMGISTNNGDRRVISGEHPDVGTVGTGPAFAHAIDVRLGPDGNYYALSDVSAARESSILRIDSATGDRTTAWQGNNTDFGQCLTGNLNSAANGVPVQYTDLGFAVDDAGNFYLGYANAVADGRGIVRISADGSSCEFVTADGVRQDGFTRGTGPVLGGFVQGYAIRDGNIYAFTTQPKQFLEIDLATGNRRAIVVAQAAGIIGERWVNFDDVRGLAWTTGLASTVTIVGVDLDQPVPLLDISSSCGDPAFPFFPQCAGGPINNNTQNIAGSYVDSATGRIFVAQDNVGILEFELETGNSIILSL